MTATAVRTQNRTTFNPRRPVGAKETVTIRRSQGPLVVDVWLPESPGQAAPILLVHGWGGSGAYWQSTAQALARTTQVIVPDLPGCGRSQPVNSAQDMFDQVEALRGVVEHFELDRVQLVGHSMGAAMTLLLADQLPDRIERVVLTSHCFFMSQEQAKTYRSIMNMIQLAMRFRFRWMADVPGLTRMMAQRYFYRVPSNETLLRQGLLDYLEMDFDTAVACADNATDPRIEGAGSRLQAPAIIIACRQDQIMPLENVAYSAELMPNCQVRWIDKCGHLPMVESPAHFMAILRNFLDL